MVCALKVIGEIKMRKASTKYQKLTKDNDSNNNTTTTNSNTQTHHYKHKQTHHAWALL